MKVQIKPNYHYFRALMSKAYLLVKSPREYLFSFTYPTNKTIIISPYDPSVTRVGKRLIKTILEADSSIPVHFYGSSALKIAGQRDIDLVIPCDEGEVDRYTDIITKLFGDPIKKKSQFSEWSFMKDTCAIEILVINKKHPLAMKMHKTFVTLRDNAAYRNAYERMKLLSHGKNEREYAQQKVAFFTSIGL